MPEEEQSETKRKFWFVASVLFVIAGVGFYWSWGVMFNTWNLFAVESLGAYVVTIPLIAVGLIGLVLTRKKPAVQQ